MKEYRWNGYTFRISDEDLKHYPGAEPIVKLEKKKAEKPKNKKATAPANKKAAPVSKKEK